MFAPHAPLRPSSAMSNIHRATPSPGPAHQHQGPAQEGGLVRRNSLTWDRNSAGLPPPPSEIDHYGDISNALISSPAANAYSLHHHSHNGAAGGLDYDERVDRQQAHMNTVNKHPKVKLELILNSNIYEAGGSISGRLEMACATSQRLRIGEIAVELEGIEELTSRDHAATQMFLFNRTMFQGEHLPPSNAVLPAAPHQGYWPARKGRTTFPFNFRLPKTAPSSVVFAGNASLRYALKATVQVWYHEDRMLVASRKDAFVVERWEDEHDEKYLEPREAVGDTRLFMGGAGVVWLEAGVAEQLFWGGGTVFLRCGVKNNTKRHIAGVRVSLARRLVFPVGQAANSGESLGPQITDVVHQEDFKGPMFEFPPNHESVFNISVQVPRDLRTIRKTRLFEVRIIALVSVLMGTFAKDLTVEVPIFVAHTASVQKAAQANLDALHHPQQQLDAHMHAVQQFAVERGWSPAPLPQPRVALPIRPGSAMSGQMIALPTTAQPFFLSQDAPGQIAWDPHTPGWTPSTFPVQPVGGVSVPAPFAPPRPASAMYIQRSFSASTEMQQQIQALQAQNNYAVIPEHSQIAQIPPLRPISAAPADLGIPTAHTQLAAQRDMTTGSTYHMQMHNQGQGNRHASAPVLSQHIVPARAAPAGMHSPAPASPAPAVFPDRSYSTSPNDATSPITNSPSPATYHPIASLPPPPSVLQGLATITEDSESQAGTVKSVKGFKEGNSVSKKDIDQFEAIAGMEDEKSEAKTKEALSHVGLQWDQEEADRQKRIVTAEAERDKGLPQPPSSQNSASSKKELSASLVNTRPRASDLFNQARERSATSETQAAAAPQSVQSIAFKAVAASRSRNSSPTPHATLNVISSTPVETSTIAQQARPLSAPHPASAVSSDGCRLSRSPHAPLAPSKDASNSRRRSISPSPGGQGLTALESRLSRPSSPMEAASFKKTLPPVVAMANIARQSAVDTKTGSHVTKSAGSVPPKASLVSAPLDAAKKDRPVSPQEQEQRKLSSEAIGRVGNWLQQATPVEACGSRSQGGMPAASALLRSSADPASPQKDRLVSEPAPAPSVLGATFVNSPKTPTPSAFVGADNITPSRFEKLVESAAERYGVMAEPRAKPRAVSYESRVQVDDVPTLSAELRALVDGSKPSGQRKGGNALKDHPISRRLSLNEDTNSQVKPGLPMKAASYFDFGSKAGSASTRPSVDPEMSAAKSVSEPVKTEQAKPSSLSSPGAMTLIHRPILKAHQAAIFLNKNAPQPVFSKAAEESNQFPAVASQESVEQTTQTQHTPSTVGPTFTSSTSTLPASTLTRDVLTLASQKCAIKAAKEPVKPLGSAHPQSSAALRSSSKPKGAACVQTKFLAALAAGDDSAHSLHPHTGAGIDGEHVGGRGTTKAIGKNKLQDLRSLWETGQA